MKEVEYLVKEVEYLVGVGEGGCGAALPLVPDIDGAVVAAAGDHRQAAPRRRNAIHERCVAWKHLKKK